MNKPNQLIKQQKIANIYNKHQHGLLMFFNLGNSNLNTFNLAILRKSIFPYKFTVVKQKSILKYFTFNNQEDFDTIQKSFEGFNKVAMVYFDYKESEINSSFDGIRVLDAKKHSKILKYISGMYVKDGIVNGTLNIQDCSMLKTFYNPIHLIIEILNSLILIPVLIVHLIALEAKN